MSQIQYVVWCIQATGISCWSKDSTGEWTGLRLQLCYYAGFVAVAVVVVVAKRNAGWSIVVRDFEKD